MPLTFFEEFGRRATRRRRMLGLFQKDVAQAIGAKRPHVSKLEHGRQVMMRLDQVAALAQVLRTSSDYLLQLVEEDPGEIPKRRSPGEEQRMDGRTPLPVTISPERSTADAYCTTFSPAAAVERPLSAQPTALLV